MLGNLGTGEVMLILVFVLIFFGAKRIPEVMRGFGSGLREFRKAAKEVQDEIENDHTEDKNKIDKTSK